MGVLGRWWRLFTYIIQPFRHTEEAYGWLTLIPQSIGVGGLIVLAFSILLGSPWVLASGILGLALSLALFAGHRLLGKIEEFEQRPAPCLIFGVPRVRKVSIGPVESTASGAANEVWIGISQVANDPRNKVSEAQVNHTVIDIVFIAADGTVVSLHGRWTENEQPGTRPYLTPIDDIRRRSLLPNGEPNYLDIVLKYEEDDACYAFNDDTCRHVKDWRDPAYRLPEEEYRVRIVLKGVGLPEDKEEWLLLRNLGVGKGMRLERSTPLVPSKEGSQRQ